MNDQIETYKNLMHDLVVLPEQISQAQSEVTEFRLRISDVEKDMAQLEPDLMQEATGKNAEERKAALLKLKATTPTWQRHETMLAALQRDAAQANDDLDYRTRVYNATCYRARLHAALLNFMAAGGQPAQTNGDVNFNMGPRSNGHVNGATVSADDAKEIGL